MSSIFSTAHVDENTEVFVPDTAALLSIDKMLIEESENADR